jgi:tRNA pseudouridine32 synthase / 23S rRNA pseudouridine746 synthase
LNIDLLYHDDDIIVINKPAGLPVHAGSGGGDNLENHLEQFQLGWKNPPQLAHRLDRDTSGCLILGRKKESLRKLGRLFEQGRIHKTYWAIVRGIPTPKQGRIDASLSKMTEDKRRWHMRVDLENGQSAITDYRTMGEYDGNAWLEMKPKTGRTHQLRVHCAHIGCPIIGDRFYGTVTSDDEPLLLHARGLSIPLDPKNPILVEAPPPPAMQNTLAFFQKKK